MKHIFRNSIHREGRSHDCSIVEIGNKKVKITYEAYNAGERCTTEFFDGNKWNHIFNGLEKPENYEEIMLSKIRSIFYIAKEERCQNIVLSAFGCGVFKNDPHFVASLFKKVIFEEGFREHFQNIAFAILNDHNSTQNNYEIFKQTLGL
jgi:hypothetical protein